MKKIAILLSLILASTASIACAGTNVGLVKVTEADGDPAAYVNELVFENGTLSVTGAQATASGMALGTNLTNLKETASSATGRSLLAAADADAAGLILGVKTVYQTASLDNEGTLTASVGNIIHTYVTGGASPTNFTIVESGNEIQGADWYIHNVAANYIQTVDTAAVAELAGTFVGKVDSILHLKYRTDRWVEVGRAQTAATYTSGINIIPATSQTNKKIITGTGNLDLLYSQLGSEVHLSGEGAKIITIEDSASITAGAHVRVGRLGTAAVTVRSLDSADVMYLNNGTPTDAGDMIALAATTGALAEFTYIGSNIWKTLDLVGTSTDGGAPAGGAGTYLTDADVIAAYYFENNPNDATANAHNLTSSSMAYITATPTPPQGTYAADFASAYGESSDVAFDATLTGNFSVTGWVYFDTEYWSPIASMGGTSGNRGWNFYRHDHNNAFIFSVSTNGTALTTAISGTDTAPIGEWIHFGLVVNGTDVTLYLNGYEETGYQFPLAFTSTSYDTTANFRVGQGYVGLVDDNRYLNGKLDVVYVIGRELSATEVLDIFTNGLE